MAAITSLGIGSGLDINSMVSQLVALERKPLTLMQQQASKLQTQVSSYGKVNSLFSSLQDASNKLSAASLWGQSVATSADTAAVGVVGGANAVAGHHAVSVQSLAGSQTVVSATATASAGDSVGAGTLTLDIGRWTGDAFAPAGGRSAVTIDVGADDTLTTLRDKINALDTGVSASLVTDASGVRLSLRSSATGADNGFRIVAADADGSAGDGAGLSRYAYDPAGAGAASGLALKQQAADARATIDGIEVVSASNDLTGAVEGLTLQLRRPTTTAVDVAVSHDDDTVKTAIKTFADAYSQLARYIADQTRYDATSKVGGPLQGDSAVTSLQQQMRGVLNNPSGASAAFPRLSDIGLQLQRDGTLTIDDGRLDSALAHRTDLQKALSNRDPEHPSNDGFARRYADLATAVLGVDGSLTTRTDGLRQRIDRNTDAQDKLQTRVDRYQQRLVAQYTAMDASLSRLTSLSSYVTQQLAAITSSTK